MTASIVGWAHTPFVKFDTETVESLVVRVATDALAGPFPDVLICPTGGIGEANAASWLSEPNVVAVGGSWLCPAAEIRSGNWAGITAICERSMKSLKPAHR